MALLGRDTTVTGPFPAGVLLLETLSGREELGMPFLFQLGLLSKNPSIDPDAVLGQPLAVGLKLRSGEWRYFHGVVSSFAKSSITHSHTRYTARLEPRISQFNHAFECRIFNEIPQDAVSIATAVLAERGLTALESGALADHARRARELCVQYRETDQHFVQRLLEEEGIYYFFRHELAGHTLVLADGFTAHATAPGYATVPYMPEQRKAAGAEEHFWGMTVRQDLYPGQHTVVSGYDPTKLRVTPPHLGEVPSVEPAPGPAYEHYDHPGGLPNLEEASREAKLRTQADRAEKTIIELQGNTVGLGAGDLVTLRPGVDAGDDIIPFWTTDGFDNQYLIVRAEYSLSVDQYETGTVAGKDEPFKAKYRLLDSQTQFRPPRRMKKVRMGGPQTALVVGPAGEEIWTDKLGRVRVQFDWDRIGGHNEKSTCWVRVAQMFADARFGAVHLPRIGQEVIVRFFDGDPDRPVVTGSLYSADNPPPYPLPGHNTQSGIKSRSSKAGTPNNFNEIRFEDLKGREELHVQAEKDMSTLVKHCQTLQVGVNRGVVVGQDEDNLVKANRELTVNVNDSVVIGGDHDKTVTGTVLQVYGGEHSRKVDGEQDLVAEQNKDEHVKQAFTLTTDKKFQLVQDATSMTFKRTNMTLDSAGEIDLFAGGASVSLEKDGTTTFASPTGIKLTCGASSLAILPGGITIAAPNLTAAAGAGSTLVLGADTVAMKSRKVTIKADGVCSIKGRDKLKLQESAAVKGKKGKGGGGAGDGDAAASAKEAKGKELQKGAVADSSMLEIHVVDLNCKPQEGLAYQIKKPDGGTESGKLDKDGRGKVKSSKPGRFTVTFPDLDGADWDGPGAEPLPPEESRTEASRYKVQQGDRLPTIAFDHGFFRWQPLWDFAGNEPLRGLRGNAHILFPNDKVSIPTKLSRKAEVEGGTVEFVVQKKTEILRVKFSNLPSDDPRTVTFKAEPDVGSKIAGSLKSDGTMEIDLPEDTKRVLVRLFSPDSSQPFETCELRVGHLDPLQQVAGVQARLQNLGYYSGPINGQLNEATIIAVSTFRTRVMGDSSSEMDAAFLHALNAAHGV